MGDKGKLDPNGAPNEVKKALLCVEPSYNRLIEPQDDHNEGLRETNQCPATFGTGMPKGLSKKPFESLRNNMRLRESAAWRPQ